MGPKLRSRNRKEPQKPESSKSLKQSNNAVKSNILSPRRNALVDQTNAIKNKSPVGRNLPNKTIDKYLSPTPKLLPGKRDSILKKVQTPKSSTSVIEHVPIYKKVWKSPQNAMAPEQRIHLYDFEIDENEPKVKKKKKRQRPAKPKSKPVRKIKKHVLAISNPAPTQVQILKALSPVEPDIIDDDSKESFHGFEPVSSTPMRPFYEVGTTNNSNMYTPMDQDVFIDSMDTKENETPLKLRGIMPPARKESLVLQPKVIRSPLKAITSEQNSQIPILFADRSVNTSLRGNNHITLSSSYSSVQNIPCSTPLKYNTLCSISCNDSPLKDTSNLNTSNFFGFDEPELFEEPLYSPIKDVGSAVTTPFKAPVPPTSEVLPVRQIIKLLRFGDDAGMPGTSADTSRMYQEEATVQDINVYDDNSEVIEHFRNPPRRSYERPFKPRKPGDSDYESSDEEEAVIENHQPDKIRNAPLKEDPPCGSPGWSFKPRRNIKNDGEGSKGKDQAVVKNNQHVKKRNAPSKKDTLELNKWIQSFNSQCKQVDEFELCIE